MVRKIILSVDVEADLHTGKYVGVNSGLKKFEELCDKYEIQPILFVTAEALKQNPGLFKKLDKKGWDISLHGFSHKRFDEMGFFEKENEISKSILLWKKTLEKKPRGFRAPQHSIDDVTLDLLEKHGIEYDSSYIPLNFLQLLFFPKKFKLWIRTCFSGLNRYKIRGNLEERPPSSLFIPFVSLTVRIFPVFLLKIYLFFLKLFYKEPMFYAHSWDFIEMPESRIDRKFPSAKFMKKLDALIN